ncbi:MAG: FG-GAP-like repeat-containing protein, partial [Lentisphaeria bacterium]|nr:FG-GAP-like repeat-containing protein [Lentisphaeria bacterium]
MTLRSGKFFGLLLIVGFGVLGGDDAADRAYYEQRMFVVTAPATREQLPARVVNTTYLPVVTTQGPLGTCGAYGVTYYYRTFLKARQKGWVRPDPDLNPERCASTAYTYKLLRRDPLAGANILGTVMDMVDFGVCNLADMPYEYDMDTYTWPEEQYWKKAMAWRPQAAGQIPAIHTLAGQAVLKSHLYGGGAGDMAVIALRNAPNVVEYPGGMHTDNEVIYALQEAKSGIQHAFTVIGYDDNREYLDTRDGLTKKGAFLAVNSWGQGWGVVLPEVGTGGFVWFAYDLFLQDLQDDWNGGTAAAVMLERGEYTPQTMIRIGVTGDTRILSGGLSPSGEGGGEWIRLFPGLGDEAHPTDQGVWVDVTDMLASGSAGIRFHCWNFEGGPAYVDDLKLASGDETVELPWTGTEPVLLSSDFMAMTRLYVGRYQDRIPTPERAILTGDAAWFDWNADGLPDAAVASPEGTWLWTNTGSGRAGLTTTAEAEYPGGHTLRWLDANGDGHIDLLIASDTATTIYAGDGTGAFAQTFATLPVCRRQAVAVADFDRDGRPDLALGEEAETAVYLNTGTGFGKILQTLPALSSSGFGYGTLAAADVDGDGKPDLLLAGAGEADWNTALTRLFRNVGLPLHFAEMATNLPAVKSPAVAFGDANGDGHPDLAISGCADPKWMRLYLNDGSGNFQERNTALPPLREGTLQWCDLDADGRPDLVATGATVDNFAEPGPRTIAVINRPDGTFADFGLPLPNAYRGFLVAQDVTGDANPDLFVGGSTTWYSEPDLAKRACALYDYSISTPGLFPVNTPPTAPDSLACEH